MLICRIKIAAQIQNMRCGNILDKFDVASLSEKWKAKRRKTRKQEPVIDE